MTKRKTKRHYTKRWDSLFEESIRLIAALSIIVMAFFYANKSKIGTFFTVYWDYFIYALYWFIWLFFVIIFYLLYKRFTTNTVEITNELAKDIISELSSFRPLKYYNNEQQYHMELAGFLKKTFPELAIEETSWNTRPDIIVGRIALEVKWPTGNRELATIADKIIRYLKHYDYIIVVLFNVEISQAAYNEWNKDIMENFAHKSDKISIISI